MKGELSDLRNELNPIPPFFYWTQLRNCSPGGDWEEFLQLWVGDWGYRPHYEVDNLPVIHKYFVRQNPKYMDDLFCMCKHHLFPNFRALFLVGKQLH